MAPPVAGYFSWYDASQIVGVSDATALTTWPDLSANANDVTQATGAQKPTYYSSTTAKLINGLPAVWFTGSNSTNLARTASVSQEVTSGVTVLAVMVGDGSSAAHGFVANRPASPFSTTNYSYYTNGNQWNGAAYDGPAYAAPATTYLVSVTQDNAGHFNSYKNKTLAGTSSSSFGAAGAYTFMVGGSTQSGEYMTGAIGELILYPSVLSTSDRQSVENYLSNKWFPTAYVPVAPRTRPAVHRASNW